LQIFGHPSEYRSVLGMEHSAVNCKFQVPKWPNSK